MIIGRMRLFLVESPIKMARAQGVGSVKGSVKRVLIALSTADGLTGWGEAAPWEVFTGTPEGKFIALDAESGDVLWSFQTGSGIVGQPITWEQDGEQYVAIISGWGGAVPLWGGEVAKAVQHINQGGALWVFKLPKA